MIMEEGIVQSWLAEEGDHVQEGKGIAEIESDKTIKEIESPVSGTLARIVVAAGDTVAVGTLIGVIAEDGDTEESIQAFIESERIPPESASAGSVGASAGSVDASAGPVGASASPVGGSASPVGGSAIMTERGQGRHISPAAMRLAKNNGIDWTLLAGSGPGGRIQVSDVEKAMLQGGQLDAPVAGKPAPLSKLRQAIARRTALSIVAPQAALCRHVDLTAFLQYRKARLSEPGSRPVSLTATLLPFIINVLHEVPELNCRLMDGNLVMDDPVHLGVVAQGDGGIFVPVLRDASTRSLAILDQELKELLERSSKNALSDKDMGGSTFTFSNAGPFGIDMFQPLLNPPEVAILGMGSIKKRPWVVGEQVVPRDTVWFCLATDHRAVDGGPAGKFLTRLDECLQNPESVLHRLDG
jgi:pyruvate dehydrogenase E2 component (dihydrolipoamide acetyltransferase)